MFEASAYGDHIAAIYDDVYPHTPDVDLAAEFISELAPQGTVLELGVGTGRLALPLADAGLRVHGVDASTGILEQLAKRDPDGRVTASVADFTKELPDGQFDVVLIGLNTLFMVPERDWQINALRLMRERLAPGAVAIVETYNPWYYHRLSEPRVEVHHLGEEELMVDTAYVNRAEQRVVIVHSRLAGGAPTKFVEVSRYAWASELELMAKVAGLRLRERHAGWDRSPVTDDSVRYISVFEADDAVS